MDYVSLDRYLGFRYSPGHRALSVLTKWLLPVRSLACRVADGEPADVLLLHPHARACRRHQGLVAELAGFGLSVRQQTVPGALRLLRSRQLLVPVSGWSAVPRNWRLQAAFAAWLTATFRPKVLVTFMDDSLHTPFLREAVARQGGMLVNVAHAPCWPNMDFSMCDVDWLLIWGRCSRRHLDAAPVRFGSCRTIEVGSIYYDPPPRMAACHRPLGSALRVLWLGQNHASAHRHSLRHDALEFASFAAAHPAIQVAIRTHPLDRGELRRLVEPLLPYARWYGSEEPLSATLGGIDVVVSSFSSGLVEAAAFGKPVVGFSTSGLAEALGLKDFRLPLVADQKELAIALEAIAAEYPDASAAALHLARDHLFEVDNAARRCAKVVHALVEGRDPADLGMPTDRLGSKLP